MNGLFDNVYAVHHLCVRDDQGRSKPEYNILGMPLEKKLHTQPDNISVSGLGQKSLVPQTHTHIHG